ncbi:unnamed protein product [Paramecium sonneborni]|uniref:Uncharacterized protein n=1 Tax=Paramecium sonneborni TaxID=65129 RepID=A0A8S1RM91_9CILI|nr:unnamed protein product [Paramecium sonneborni]
MIFCDDHPSNPIVFICTGNHNCKRKLCAQCQFEHKVASNKDFIPAQLFQKIIEEKIDQVKNHPKSLQDRIKKDFKSFIGETINILKIQLDIIIEQILQKFEQLEKEDQRYSNIFESGIHLLELSQQDLDFIIGILNNQLERWLIYKDNYCIQLNNTIKNFKKDAENYHQQINLVQEKIASMENQKCQGLKKFFTILQKTEFQISYSKDIKIIYQQDGEILKIDEIEIYQNKPESIINLEQIKHLTWKGQLDKNQKKVGNWYPLWKGETINAGGNYGDDGKKIGDWVELIDNFWDQAQVFEIGKYQNNYKCGIWDIIKNQKKIGGGEYIKNGIKNGNWTQLDNNYYEGKKVVYNGKYLDGKKCQKWNIILDGECIGGGSYDDDGQKDGEWRELHFNFNELIKLLFFRNNRITEIGIYKNGKKVGKWEIKNEGNQIMSKKLQLFFSGEGTFDQCGLKNGNWVELHDYYSVQNQITYLGEYRNGKKCNRWDTKFKIEEEVVQEEIIGEDIIIYMNRKIKIGQNCMIILIILHR